MAVDETLLDGCVDDSGAAPTLRLYGWRPAALSLGSSQAAAGAHAPDFLKREGIDLVRRPTGGAAVLHEHERTYAVVGRLDRAPFEGGVRATYRRVARALSAGLQAGGLPAAEAPAVDRDRTLRAPEVACFAGLSDHEIAVAGLKLVGSAQFRRRSAFLQHGSILLRSEPARLAGALGAERTPAGFTDLERVLGRVPDERELDASIVRGFEQAFSVRLVASQLTDAENVRATRLRSRKYLSAAWTIEGRV